MRAKWDRSKGRPEPIRALNRIIERENGEPLVDIAEVAPSVLLPRPQTIPFVRETVARMAEQAAQLLPKGVHLAVTDAWRPIERQRRIYEWMMQAAKEAFPHLPYATLRRKVNRLVAPVDQPAPPGHCTGAAIDVILVDSSGEPLDVSSPFSRFGAHPTFAVGLDAHAQQNRLWLVESMLTAGFSNCRDEWWHYSYGDAGWAVRMGHEECFYGLIDLEGYDFHAKEADWLKALAERENPWLPKEK